MGKKSKDPNKLKKQIETATIKVAQLNIGANPIIIGNIPSIKPNLFGSNEPIVKPPNLFGSNEPVVKPPNLFGSNEPVVKPPNLFGSNEPVVKPPNLFGSNEYSKPNQTENNNHIIDSYTEYKYKILKNKLIKDEQRAIEFRNSEEYKHWYNTEYKQTMEEMAEKKRRFCTGHILEPTMVFNPLIRLDFCEKCKSDTENKRMHFELKVPKYEKLEYVKKELNKLETVQREIKYAYTCILNNHTGEILDLFNALFTMQNNILDNDINRFKQEKEVLLVEYYKTYDNFGLFIPPRFPVLSFTEEEIP